jgi:UPF0716 protein FxsA
VLRYLPVMILGVLVADLASLIWLGGYIGVLGVIGLVVVDIAIGTNLIRRSGTSLTAAIRGNVVNARTLSGHAVSGFLTALAGVLFLLPGFVSDILALVLLLPMVSEFVAGRVATRVSSHVVAARGYRPTGPIIEAEVIEAEPVYSEDEIRRLP